MKLCFFSILILCFCYSQSYSLKRRKVEWENPRAKRQSGDDGRKKMVCYFASWSGAQRNFTPEDIDPRLCTHILYSYGAPDLQDGLTPSQPKFDIQDKYWERFVALKRRNPDAKYMIAVGGLFEGSQRFTKIFSDPKTREIFVNSVVRTLNESSFDGIDMGWLYPGFSEGSSKSDRINYVTGLKELREKLGNDYLISINVPGLEKLLEAGFDMPEIIKYVDFVNVWAGAYHDSTAPVVNHPAQLYPLANGDPGDKDANVDATMRILMARGVPPSMIVLLIANYGNYYLLDDENQTDLGSPTEDEGLSPEWTGSLIYNEICEKIQRENWTVKRVNATAMGPYAYKGKEWVAWDDEEMVKTKTRYAVERNLGGVGFWTIDMDDYKGICSVESYPLLKAANQILFGSEFPVENYRTHADLTERIIFRE